MNIIDIFLILLVIFLIYNLVNNRNYTNIEVNDNDNIMSNNIIFDDDITIFNNGESKKELNNRSQFLGSRENFENTNTQENKDIHNISSNTQDQKYIELYSKKNINKSINELIDLPNKTLENELKDNKFYLSEEANEANQFIPKNESRLNNRYNKKYNNIPTELDLYNMRKYNLKNDNYSNDNLISNLDNTKNLNVTDDHIDMKYVNKILYNKNDIDTKIFNKTNKSQKLYKDAKTIAGRFTKNSIINDYKYELDYYQKLRTPWWEENVE